MRNSWPYAELQQRYEALEAKHVALEHAYQRLQQDLEFFKNKSQMLDEQLKNLTEQHQNQAQVAARVPLLEAENLAFRHRLGLNSTNSHLPPSSDGFKKEPVRVRSLREKTHRLSGGQVGHEGETLQQVETPDHIVKHRRETCMKCGESLQNAPVVRVEKRQSFDIPLRAIEVTEYQAEEQRCLCGCLNPGEFPAHVTAPAQYGPNMMALGVYLNQAQFIPEDRASETMRDIFGQGPSAASIATWVNRTAERFKPYVEAIYEVVKASPVKHMDETGCRAEKKTQWMHVLSTSWLTHYRFSPKRGDVPEGLLGHAVHDHFKSYFKKSPNALHALCNEHHLRELKALIDIEKEPWAQQMTDLLRKVCSLSKLPEVAEEKVLQEIYKTYDDIVQNGLDFHNALPPLPRTGKRGRKKNRKGYNLIVRVRDFKDCVLRCLKDPDVPFTNNQGEQDLRMVKVRQKISGCFRTPKGAQIFSIHRSMYSSARKQKLNVLEVIKHPELLAITGPPPRLPQSTKTPDQSQ